MNPDILLIGAYPPPNGGAEFGNQRLVNGLLDSGYDIDVQPITLVPNKGEISPDSRLRVYPTLVTPFQRLARILLRKDQGIECLTARSLANANTPEQQRAAIILLRHQEKVRQAVNRYPYPVKIISPLWHTIDILTPPLPNSNNVNIGIARGSDVRTIGDAHHFQPYIDSISGCDHVICISPSLQRSLGNIGLKSPMTTILPAINEIFFTTPLLSIEEITYEKAKLGIPENAFVFGHVSTNSEVKKIEDIIHAFGKLVTSQGNPDKIPYLLIAGEGETTVRNRLLVHKLGITDRVKFVGKKDIKEVPNLFDLFDAFILASKSEGLATVVLESMSRHVPVICSDIPGPTDIIEHEKNGLLFEQGNADSLCEAILLFMGNTHLRNQLKAGTIDYAKKLARLKDWTNKHIAIIEQVKEAKKRQ